MSITWMKSKAHGYMPCDNGLQVEHAKKNGWVECGPPPWPKEGAAPVIEEEPDGFDPNAIVMSADEDLVVEKPQPKKKPKGK